MLVITNKRWKNGPNFTPRILAIPTGKKFNLEPKQNFWPYPYRDGWENSDGGWIHQDQRIRDSHGWDENKWYDDVDDGGQENVAGSASQDEQFFWFEFSKALDSGDPHDWSWQPGNVVGTNRTGDLMLGIGSPDFPAHFFHLIRLELNAP